MEILVLGTVRRASEPHTSAEQGCFRLPLPLPPTISVPPPLPPTISVGGSGHLPLLPPSAALASHYLSGRLRLLPPSAALASHYLSGRLRPSAASAFRCPCLPLSQWEAQAPSAASAFRCPCLPLSQWEAQTFRCFRVPLPLPPTISVGGSGSFRLRALVTLVQWALKCQELDSANGSE